jgi:hypothetical protein
MSNKGIAKCFFSFGLAVLGFFFSLIFQDMAYWGGVQKGVANTLVYYWIGAVLSYVFSILSVILMCIKNKRDIGEPINYTLMFVSILLIIATILWTTFIIIAGQSGF